MGPMSRDSPPPKALAQGPARSLGLRERVGFALAALILACSVGLSFGLAAYARTALLDNATRELDTLARQTARELSYGMERFVREIELQAANPIFSQPVANPAQMRRALEEIQRVHPEFSHISVVDIPSATVIAATGGIFEGGNGRGRPVFEQGQKGLFVADVHEAVRLANVLPKPASGEPLRFLDAAAPVRGPEGAPIRVLGFHLSWEWTASIRNRVLDPVEANRGVQLMLVDTAGNVALPPSKDVKVGAKFSELAGGAAPRGVGAWSDGEQYLTSEAPTFASGSFPGLGWRVVARQPLDVALAPARRLRDLVLLAGALLGLLAAGLGWVVAGRLVKPVTHLARDARAATQGNRLVQDVSDELPEVATVRAAFDRVTGESESRAERLLSELDAVYQGTPVALCVVDAQMRYTRFNELWAQALGSGESAPESLAGAISQAFAAAEPVTVEIETREAGGSRIWRTVLAPLRRAGGSGSEVSIVAADITDIRAAERELREADSRKNQFVSMLAHELRNPLAPIANALEVLDRSPPEHQAARMREMMRGQVRRMARLIDDLLDVSRITHGKVAMRREPVSIRDVCQAAIDTVKHLIDNRGQRLRIAIDEDLPRALGDKVRLEQIVCNLLSNASKYGRDGGRIELIVTGTGAGIQIVVEDDGQGIAADFLPRVFDMFAQGHASVDRPDGGLGIGLTLVKSLVELHGGDVKAESDGPGLGARFTVSLPADAIEGHRAVPAVASESDASIASK